VTEERRQILEMLATGKINADEADRLLGALQGEQPAATATATPNKPAPKFLRVIIDSTNEWKKSPVHINVRVPVALLRAGVRFASFIPTNAQERVNEELHKNGMNFDISQIKPENLNELIDQLQDVSIDIDSKQDDVKIKIFAE
jgi:polyhydroxyalkanoate synthesis regulator phasin